jgi:hypothetical protein
MKLRRRRVAITLRYSPRERPVARMRMLPNGSTMEYWSAVSQLGLPGAGRSSSVYRAASPGSFRQTRGPLPVHTWLTGAASVALGGGTLVHFR